MDFHFPEKQEVQVRHQAMSFDYDVLQHSEEPLRRMLRLRVSLSEHDGNDEKVGHDIQCEINGQFIVPEKLEAPEQEGILRVNGLSILYSTLRGILGNITGSFPGERLCLPTILPQEIAESIEERKKNSKEGSVKKARKKLPEKAAKKSSTKKRTKSKAKE